MSYHIVVIPCYTSLALDEKVQAQIHKAVNETWGRQSLHPTVIAKLAADLGFTTSVQIGAVVYAILRELVRVEHNVGGHYYKHFTPDSPIKARHLTELGEAKQTTLVRGLVDKINPCWESRPITEDMLDILIENLYLDIDYPHLMPTDKVAPPLIGRPDMIAEPFVAAAAMAALRVAPGYIDASTALVVLDDQYNYAGHIYVWVEEHLNTLYVMGLRASLINLVCRQMGDITGKLFRGVATYAEQQGYTKLVVVRPYDHVVKILTERFGATLNDEADVISDVATLSLRLPIAATSFVVYGVQLSTVMRAVLDQPLFEHDLSLLVAAGGDREQLMWLARECPFGTYQHPGIYGKST